MVNLFLGIVLSLALAVGFPPLPSPESLVQQSLGVCESGAILDVRVYQTQEKPQVIWVVFRASSDKPVAVQLILDDTFSQAWILKDGKVQEFLSLEELFKVSESPCDLLPKGPQV